MKKFISKQPNTKISNKQNVDGTKILTRFKYDKRFDTLEFWFEIDDGEAMIQASLSPVTEENKKSYAWIYYYDGENGYYCKAKIKNSKYTTDKKQKFVITQQFTNKDFSKDSKMQNKSKDLYAIAMKTWDISLREKTKYKLSDIGFDSFTNNYFDE